VARHRFSHLKTRRLSLIPVPEADPDAIAAVLDDIEITRWLARVPHPYSRADAVAFQDRCLASQPRQWIALDDEGVAGGVGTEDHLGYWVARRAWGRGYAPEMALAAIDAWFADPNAGPLVSGHFEGNLRSRRILERLGFRPDGESDVHSLSLGRPLVHCDMVLSRDAWREARLRIARK
jgi:RimJ/RimL family protein N-acetyltransferase